MKKLFKHSLLTAAGACLLTTNSFASVITGSGTVGGLTVSASADFQVLGGNQLQVTLTSTTPNNSSLDIAQILYGVYFNGSTGLSLVSATAPIGAKDWDLHTSAIPTILASAVTAPSWTTYSSGGLSGALGLTGTPKQGILNTAFNGIGNGVGGNGGLGNAQHSPDYDKLILLFNYTTFDQTKVTDTVFRFGTGVDFIETHPPTSLGTSVPEPSTVVAGALLLVPFGIGAIRNLRKDRKD